MNQEIRDRIAEYNPDAIVFDDLDDAIIGIGQQHGSKAVVVYDSNKYIEIFRQYFLKSTPKEERGEIDYDPYLEAISWFECNVEYAYVGENTPIFLAKFDD